MALNDDGVSVLAAALQTKLVYMQLHSEAAGDGTDNIAVAARQLVYWTIPDGGVFGLASQVRFTGGEAGGVASSVTLWDIETDGTFYGEYALTGDRVFNAQGEFIVTALDFTVTASDA